MTIKLTQAKLLLTMEKVLLPTIRWQSGADRHAKNMVWQLECRARFEQTIPRGLWFRAYSWQRYPLTASIQLDCDFPENRSHLPLYRFDLRPFSSHTNGPSGPKDLVNNFIDVGVSHEHSYLWYDDEPDLDLKGDQNPLARILDKEPRDVDEALNYVCNVLNIINRTYIPSVPLQTELV